MIPIFYRPEMSAPTDSYSPSSGKPQAMVEHWLASGMVKPEQIASFEPATRSDYYLAHKPGFVDALLDCRIDNGFGNRSPQVAAALPYTTGSMIAATQHVLQHGGYACSPTSGFHHAGYDYAGGFCSLNGLAVAAILAVAQGAKVGILDFDAHYGDGTDHILRRITGHGIIHHTFGKEYRCGRPAHGWLAWLWDAIADLETCDVVLYQAGADPYEHDPLGGQLTLKELSVRDHTVFNALPNVAWNLAGGYATEPDGSLGIVQQIHDTTLRTASSTQHNRTLA